MRFILIILISLSLGSCYDITTQKQNTQSRPLGTTVSWPAQAFDFTCYGNGRFDKEAYSPKSIYCLQRDLKYKGQLTACKRTALNFFEMLDKWESCQTKLYSDEYAEILEHLNLYQTCVDHAVSSSSLDIQKIDISQCSPLNDVSYLLNYIIEEETIPPCVQGSRSKTITRSDNMWCKRKQSYFKNKTEGQIAAFSNNKEKRVKSLKKQIFDIIECRSYGLPNCLELK